MIQSYVAKLQAKENLSSEEMRNVMELIMSGNTAEEKISAFLLALREKGPTVE